MKTSRLLGYAAVGVVVLGTCLIAFVAWNFLVPSAEARELSAVYANRPRAVDADNGYVYLWGFVAPDGADPAELGQKRIAWALKQAANPDSPADDPLSVDVHWMTTQRSPAMRRLMDDCRDGAATLCAAAFREWPLAAGFGAMEKLQATRYGTMLSRHRWYEVVPFESSLPLQPYGEVMDAQRAWLLQAREAALAGDAARVNEMLERDLAFWRESLRSSDILISKMMAAVAIRNSLFFGNLAMRELPPGGRAAAIPLAWRKPFTADELSMLRPIAGEYHWTSSYLWKQDAVNLAEFEDSANIDVDYSPAEMVAQGVAQVFPPLQRRLNQRAGYDVAALRAFSVPLDRYEAVAKEFGDRAKPNLASDITSYFIRIGSLEGMRRAALLTAELRGRGIPAEQVSAELIAANSARNPLTLQPFSWDPTQRAVIYKGPEQDRWKRYTYFY